MACVTSMGFVYGHVSKIIQGFVEPLWNLSHFLDKLLDGQR